MAHPIADPMFVLLSKHNTGMFCALRGNLNKVSIMRTENISACCRPLQMIMIAFTKSFQVTSGDSFNTTAI